MIIGNCFFEKRYIIKKILILCKKNNLKIPEIKKETSIEKLLNILDDLKRSAKLEKLSA